MPFCTIKFSKAAARATPKSVHDARMAMHIVEADDDLGDFELWEGTSKLCSVESCGPGVWRIKR